ncbi:MAG TPA: CBS domain-containing protein [Hyphomicrobiaceae bacterium]|nr:CBS domain-containing protein [Hyphomicrobiaceae bacterium]
MHTTIRSILKKKGSTVHAIAPEATVFDALTLMAETNVGALIVMDTGKLVGMLSERDYARKIILKGRTSPDTKVSDIMTTRVLCTTPDQTVQDCMALMTAKAVRHLPVLNHKDVVGLVSIGDLVKEIIGEQQFMIEQLESYIHGSA